MKNDGEILRAGNKLKRKCGSKNKNINFTRIKKDVKISYHTV